MIDTSTRKIVERIPVGPGPRGLALDATSDSLYVSAFDRTGVGTNAVIAARPANTLTVVSLPSTAAKGAAAKKVNYDFAPVGQGSCSVAVLNTDELSIALR